MADGWHLVHMPAGHGAWCPDGHGVLTRYETSSRGGTYVEDDDDAEDDGTPMF